MPRKKGPGWHGESRRHSLARRGIRTVPENGRLMQSYGIRYDGNGSVMVSEGILGDLWDKAKSAVTKSKIGTKLKEIGTSIKEKVSKPKSPEIEQAKLNVKQAKQKAKEDKAKAKEAKAEVKKVKKDIKADRKKDFGERPSESDVDISNKGRLGAIKEKVASTEHKVSENEMNDVTDEMFGSPDADSIIALAENSEKLIDYGNELKYDINMLRTEGKRLQKRFSADERREQAILQADMRKDREAIERKIRDWKSSGADPVVVKNKVARLKADYEQKYNQRKAELDALKLRDRVTLKYIKDLSDDLERVARKIDKRIRYMTASGVKKDGDK